VAWLRACVRAPGNDQEARDALARVVPVVAPPRLGGSTSPRTPILPPHIGELQPEPELAAVTAAAVPVVAPPSHAVEETWHQAEADRTSMQQLWEQAESYWRRFLDVAHTAQLKGVYCCHCVLLGAALTTGACALLLYSCVGLGGAVWGELMRCHHVAQSAAQWRS
jgi:hypothetical protein